MTFFFNLRHLKSSVKWKNRVDWYLFKNKLFLRTINSGNGKHVKDRKYRNINLWQR